MKTFTIYLDMDGVLSNFNMEYEKTFGMRPDEAMRDSKNKSLHWEVFCKDHHFAKLELMPGAEELLRFVDYLADTYDIDVEILSSSGGEKYHDVVAHDKRVWLSSHIIDYKTNIVPGRKNKAMYATANSVLIDDTKDVVEAFRANGGHAILHTSVNKTIPELVDIFFDWKKN